MSSDLLLVIPARGGSKRLPRKNLADLCGRSLIAHTAAFLAREGALDAAIVSTDDAEIAEEARRCGLAVPFLRSAALSTDAASTYDVVVHALDSVRASRGDPVVTGVLQVTSPLRRPGLLRDARARLQSRPELNSVVAMSRLHVPASYVFAAAADGSVAPTSAVPSPAMVPTGSLYLTRTSALLAQASLYARPIAAIEVGPHEAIDIDTADDLALARALAARDASCVGD